MKILVPVKRVVDHNIRIRVKPDGSGVDLANIKMSINPFDEIAIEEALRLREAGKASEVVLVSIGPAQAADVLRHGLSLSADRAILVKTDDALEPLAVAKILKAITEDEKPGLILCGKQAIDDDCNQTGQMLAALLGWGQATFASKVTLEGGRLEGGRLEVEREIDGGKQTLSVTLPAVVTTDLRLNKPRYAALPAIMKARRTTIEEKSLADFGIDTSPRLEILSTAEPLARKRGVIVASVQELVEKLAQAGAL